MDSYCLHVNTYCLGMDKPGLSMKTDDLYQFFGSTKNISNAIGISRSAFYKWILRGYIPLNQQKHIELLTKGKLTAVSNKSFLIEEIDIHNIYLPMFRYYDKKYGMCEVESIHFRKGKKPKIVYIKSNDRTEKFSSFITHNLMQAVKITDINGKNVYEGDILLLKNKQKFFFRSMDMVNKLKKVGKFKIIGNIFE